MRDFSLHRPQRIQPGPAWPLFDIAATRRIESAALARVQASALMQRAGLSVARLALAIAPHARTVWVAAGPGNNGGDGLEAAAHLQRWGKDVAVTWLGSFDTSSSDTIAALQHAQRSGVRFLEAPPVSPDYCIDALLGIGASRAPTGRVAEWVRHMHFTAVPVLAVDMPTGVDADTGLAAETHVTAQATLCLLTLKPGLFTANGRDASASVWLDDLQVDWEEPEIAALRQPRAVLSPAPTFTRRSHASHKGSFGDVVVVGGARGMAGAALLAGSAALHAGAGRVYVSLLDTTSEAVLSTQPELMARHLAHAPLAKASVICGCGGGDTVHTVLPEVLERAASLVLDADALNAIANDTQLRALLRHRATRQGNTILTPHPLEAARLLECDTAAVQAARLECAETLATSYGCTVVLKGSGTVIAHPGKTSSINPTGNGRLATAGTGDVLAGALGTALAAGIPDFDAAVAVAYRHGAAADRWRTDQPLTASVLARAMYDAT